jgi:hypothetical protein
VGLTFSRYEGMCAYCCNKSRGPPPYVLADTTPSWAEPRPDTNHLLVC